MRIGTGLLGQTDTAAGILDEYRKAEAAGFDAVWVSNIFSHDAITVCALAGQVTERIELGTFVVPTYPRHPTAIAQQALTAQSASGNRHVLGIGLSHKLVIEDMFGLDYSKPIGHMREYLSVLMPLLAGEAVSFSGKHYRVNAQVAVPGANRPTVVVAALGPQMLRLTGAMADGTAVWMGGPDYLEKDCIPVISQAASEAGRPAPRVVVAFPVALTDKTDAATEAAGKGFAMYGQLPSYRAILDKQGAAGPADIAMIGDETTLRRQVERLRDIGVTDFSASPFPVPGDEGAITRTTEFVANLAKAGV